MSGRLLWERILTLMSGQTAIDISFNVSFFDGIPFIKRLLALCQPDFAFRMTSLTEVNSIGYNRESFFIDAALQFFQFGFGEQQFSGAFGFMLEMTGMFVFVDMQILDVEFIMAEHAISITHIGLS